MGYHAGMAVFFWSDLHVGHVRLAETWRAHRGGTVEAHNESLRSSWCQVVTPDDTVVIVGDLIMGNFDAGLAFVDALPGRKVLIAGNHDRHHPSCSKTETKQANARRRYEGVVETVYDLVVMGDRFGLPDTIICHFPWKGTPDHTAGARDLIDTYGPDKDEYPGSVLIHGHTHVSAKLSHRAIHVGVDAWQCPVTADSLRLIVGVWLATSDGETPLALRAS